MVTRGTHGNPWKAISSGTDKFKWVGEDIWVGDSSLASLYPRLYRISHNTNALIASIIRWNSLDSLSWDL